MKSYYDNKIFNDFDWEEKPSVLPSQDIDTADFVVKNDFQVNECSGNYAEGSYDLTAKLTNLTSFGIFAPIKFNIYLYDENGEEIGKKEYEISEPISKDSQSLTINQNFTELSAEPKQIALGDFSYEINEPEYIQAGQEQPMLSKTIQLDDKHYIAFSRGHISGGGENGFYMSVNFNFSEESEQSERYKLKYSIKWYDSKKAYDKKQFPIKTEESESIFKKRR